MFNSVYNVYVDPRAANPVESAEFIPEGLSLAAFILTGLWTLFYRLWLVSFIILGINALLSYWSKNTGSVVETTAYTAIIQLGMSVIIATCGHDWRCSKLERKGYQLVDVVTGSNLLQVQQRFYDRYLSGTPLPVRHQPMTRLERLRQMIQGRGEMA